jgi:uncharacterized protein (DUF1697 family)
MSIVEKLNDIIKIVGEISDEDENVGKILFQGLGISINTLDVVFRTANLENESGEKLNTLDVSSQIELVSQILGFSLEEMVMHIIQKNSEMDLNDKEPDTETMNFLTSNVDVDDYEKFLEENKVKDNLNFLSKEL